MSSQNEHQKQILTVGVVLILFKLPALVIQQVLETLLELKRLETSKSLLRVFFYQTLKESVSHVFAFDSKLSLWLWNFLNNESGSGSIPSISIARCSNVTGTLSYPEPYLYSTRGDTLTDSLDIFV